MNRPRIRVTLCCGLAPQQVFEQVLDVAEGSTLCDVVMASHLPVAPGAEDWQAMTPGVWGRAAAWSDAVRAGDRIELCRPLRVDPKVARRERFQQQGARGAGLFAKRRPGGKAGY